MQKKRDFDFLRPCHELAILVDFCMDSLLNLCAKFSESLFLSVSS